MRPPPATYPVPEIKNLVGLGLPVFEPMLGLALGAKSDRWRTHARDLAQSIELTLRSPYRIFHDISGCTVTTCSEVICPCP